MITVPRSLSSTQSSNSYRNTSSMTLVEIMIGMTVFSLMTLGIAATSHTSQNIALKNFYALQAYQYATVFFSQLKAMPYDILDTYVDAYEIPMYGIQEDATQVQNIPLFTASPDLTLTISQELGRTLALNVIPALDRPNRSPDDSPYSYNYIKASLTYLYKDPFSQEITPGITFVHAATKQGNY